LKELQTSNYIQNGTEIYSVHGPPITSATLGVLSGRIPGFTIVVRRLVFPDSRLDSRFEFGDSVEPEDFLALGPEARLRALTARSPQSALTTDLVFSYSFEREERGFRMRFACGMDEIVVRIPNTEGDSAIEVNGALLPPDSLGAPVWTVASLAPDADTEGSPLVASLTDPFATANRLVAFAEIVDAVDAVPASAFGECGDDCLTCVIEGVAYVGSFVGYGLCGVTSGAGCVVGAVIGHFVASAFAVKDCSRCLICLDRNQGGGVGDFPDQPNCPTGYMPCGGGTCCADPHACPPGYHECGYDVCCSDTCSQCFPCVPVCACGCE